MFQFKGLFFARKSGIGNCVLHIQWLLGEKHEYEEAREK
jgi:hypothetical protein